MSITRVEGIEHSCVGVEQQALLGQQSATATVGNEVREKSSLSEMPRRKITKDSWTKEENRKLRECYAVSSQRKGVIERDGIWKQEGMKEVREQ